MKKRLAFDGVLTALLVFEMLYQLTGNTAHEVVGAAFFACICAHIALNHKWIGAAAHAGASRKLTQRNKLLSVIACLLGLDILLLAFSSVVISETLWNAGVNLTALNPGSFWYPVHVGCSYALCILVLFHLSAHWASVAEVLSIEYDPARRAAIEQGINAVLTAGTIGLGIGGIMRTSFEATEFVVGDPNEEGKTVKSGYRERNAETGEVVEDAFDVQVVSTSGAVSSAGTADDGDQEAEPLCPICPRQCKLSAPRCERPYEQGLISR